MTDWLDSLIREYIGSRGVMLADFAMSVAIAFGGAFIGLRLSNYLLKLIERMMDRAKLETTLKTFLMHAISLGLKLLIVLWAVKTMGLATTSIFAVLGSMGVAVGMSFQGSLSNIAGGIILLFMKPFVAGDFIQEGFSGKEGTVKAVGIMYTQLLSIENELFYIPNGNLSAATITNYTAEGKRRVKINIGIDYCEDIQMVRDVIEEVILKEEARLEQWGHRIIVDSFNDSSVNIGFFYWTLPENYWTSKWRIQENVLMAFYEKNVNIPYNRMDVTILEDKDS